MTDIASYTRSNRERFEDELFEYLGIPSVSTEREYRDDVLRCADWVAARLREAGVGEVEVVETEGHPIVLGTHEVRPDAPTLLVYGHYDVQPVDPVDAWDSPPFEPTVREGRVYARGATDNKGQNHMHIKALETCSRVHGEIPVNLRVVIEGEEEVGSEHLEDFLGRQSERLAADAVLLSDTQMFEKGLPSIICGLRGIAYFEVRVRGPSSDLHSGVYGGPVDNPANVLAGILARLKDEDGRVTVPGFYDRVRPITEQEREEIERLPFDEEAFREELGVPALGGESGYGALEKIGYRPTLDVNGLLSGFTGEGAKTVLPAEAMAKVSMRLVPDQDPAEVSRAFRSHVESLAPDTVEVEVEAFQAGKPWADRPTGPLADAAVASLTKAFGREPVFVREGGSIPIIPLFAETFDAPVLPIGFALPGCNLHAPNEWLDLEVYHTGIDALSDLYLRAGEL